MTDPFERLTGPIRPIRPRDAFTRALRARLEAELGLVQLPARRATPMTSTTPTTPTTPTSTGGNGGIWPSIVSADAGAMIRFVVDVLGFTEQVVVPGRDPGVVEHSQLRWPEGGIVQVASADRPGNVFSQRPVGSASIYVVTADPAAVQRRCRDAGVETVRELMTTDYDPGGSVFAVRDHEGNLWSFGTYAGEPDPQ